MSPFDPVSSSAEGVAMRQNRAELKQSIARGEKRIIELFDDSENEKAPPVLRGLRVDWFLQAIPGMGVTKVERLLTELGIRPTARLGGLRIRQRTALRVQVVRLFRHYLPHLRGTLLVLVGPTAVGKGTIVSWITQNYPEFVLSVSATTRKPRRGEREGEHYYFVAESEFDRLITAGELLEWATVHESHRYGTPQAPVEDLLDQGKNVILEIDIQGARSVAKRVHGALRVFVAPPSFEELERRLAQRGTEDGTEREVRLRTAVSELAAQDECDFVVINSVVEHAGQSIVDLVIGSTHQTASKE